MQIFFPTITDILLSTSLLLHLHLSIIARHYCAASLKCVVHPQILVMSYVSSRVFAHVYAFICFIIGKYTSTWVHVDIPIL